MIKIEKKKYFDFRAVLLTQSHLGQSNFSYLMIIVLSMWTSLKIEVAGMEEMGLIRNTIFQGFELYECLKKNWM